MANEGDAGIAARRYVGASMALQRARAARDRAERDLEIAEKELRVSAAAVVAVANLDAARPERLFVIAPNADARDGVDRPTVVRVRRLNATGDVAAEIVDSEHVR